VTGRSNECSGLLKNGGTPVRNVGRTKECYVWAAVLGKGRILLLRKSILLFLARAGSLSKISLFLLIIGLKG
jgi:hypothetical protein